MTAPIVPLTVVIKRPADRCLKLFCSVELLGLWMDGIKKARLVRTDADGLPLEVAYEFGDSLTYSLVYSYDRAARRVEWNPRSGRPDAVSGFATFEDAPEGCLMTYALTQGTGRSPFDQELGGQTRLLRDFARWVESGPA